MRLYYRFLFGIAVVFVACVSVLSCASLAFAETTVKIGFDVWGNDRYDLSSDNTGPEEFRVDGDETGVQVTAFGVGKIKAGKGCVDIAIGVVTCSLADAKASQKWFKNMVIYGSSFDDDIKLNVKLSKLMTHVTVSGNSGDDLIDAAQASTILPNREDVHFKPSITLEGNNDKDELIAPSNPAQNSLMEMHTTLTGGLGDDLLTGGSGNDDFVAESVVDGNDTIVNASEGDSADYHLRTDPVSVQIDGQRTSGDLKTGEKDLIPLSMPSITGGKGDDHLAISPGVAPGESRGITGYEGNDTIFGSEESNDHLGGSAGDDVIYGLGGDDVLSDREGTNKMYGGSGDDYMYSGGQRDDLQGGKGNDFIFPVSPIYYKLPHSYSSYSGGDGVDTFSFAAIRSTLSDSASVTLNDVADDVIRSRETTSDNNNVQSDIENVITGDGRDEIIGSAFANTIDAGAGDDDVDGGGGDDRLIGREGNDVLKGGNGVDSVDYGYAPKGVSVTIDGVADDGISGRGEVDNVHRDIEIVFGSAFNDVLIGNDGENSLIGGAGSDRLDGGAGIDRLDGGDDDDRLDARDGVSDNVVCGLGLDTSIVDVIDDLGRGDCELIDVLTPKVNTPKVNPPSSDSSSPSGDRGRSLEGQEVDERSEGSVSSVLRLAFVKSLWSVTPSKRRKTVGIGFTASKAAEVKVDIWRVVKRGVKKDGVSGVNRGKKLVSVKRVALSAKAGMNSARFDIRGLKAGVTYVLQVTELAVQNPVSARAKLKLRRGKR